MNNDDYLLNKHLLLVDDEQELLDMVLSILNEYGFHNITTAKSMKDAIAAAQKFRPELAILDVMLPDGNGFDLMEQLKRYGDYPILFLTARGEDDDKFKGFGLGADDYIVKPFLPKELLFRIMAILRRRNTIFLSSFPAVNVAKNIRNGSLSRAVLHGKRRSERTSISASSRLPLMKNFCF